MDRRQFLKSLAIGLAGVTVAAPAANGQTDISVAQTQLKINRLRETPTICSYCAVGCGIILYSDGKQIIFAEGDPDHPINEGTLCLKGSSLGEVNTIIPVKKKREPNKRRITVPLYRAPGSSQWQQKDWDWIISTIAQRIKATRDSSFETVDKDGVTVNRTLALASFGSASLDNEENYLLCKAFRSWGMVNIEHHARL